MLGVRARVRDRSTAPDELAQPRHLGMPVGDRVVGKLRCRELEVERARRRDADGALDRAGPAREPPHLFCGRSEVRKGCGREPAVDLVERTPGAHRRERGRQRTARGCRVVHVVGGDHLDTGAQRDLRERVVAVPVEGVAVVPQLDEHTIAAERIDQLVHRALGRAGTVALQRGRHRALPAAGRDEPCVVLTARDVAVQEHGRACGIGQTRERRHRRALLAGQLRRAHRACEPRVPDRPFREHEQVLPRRVGDAVRRLARCTERQFRTEDGGEADLARNLGEADDPVEAVVVGERERREPEPGRFLDQFLRVAGTVEEGEIRMAVQLGIGVHACPSPPGRRRVSNTCSYVETVS